MVKHFKINYYATKYATETRLAQNIPSARETIYPLEIDHRQQKAEHHLRGWQMPKLVGMLGARHGHFHDHGKHLYPLLQVLQRGHRATACLGLG